MSFTTLNLAPGYEFSRFSEGDSGSAPMVFTVRRSGDLTRADTVAWSVTGTGDSPADGTDFAGGGLPAGVLAFAPGQSSGTIAVNIAGDTTFEPYETFALGLSSPSSGASLGSAVAIGEIFSDDHAISLTPVSVDRAEGNGGETLYTFRANFLPGGSSSGFGALWTVTGSGANPATAEDFVGGVMPSGAVWYAPRTVSSELITVRVAGDRAQEADEGFTLTLGGPYRGTAVTLLTPAAEAVIRNDDATISIEAGPLAVAEGPSGNTLRGFALTRTGDLSAAQQVGWSVAGTGANPADAADFSGGALPSGTVTFAAGQAGATLSVAIAGDARPEADEGYAVTLTRAADGPALGNATAAGIILDDGAPASQPAASAPARIERTAVGSAGIDEAAIAGGFRSADVTAAGGLPSRVTLGEAGAAYTLRGVEVLDFADGRLVFDAADPAAQVVRLFNAALARDPDQAGLNYYVDFLQGGRSLAEIGRGFLASPEFAARFGAGLGDDAYVLRLYENVLERGASEAELDFYRAQFAAGTSREQVLANFSESPENQARTAGLVAGGIWDLDENAATVARLYDAMFGRLPDLEGLRFYRGQLDAGTLTPRGFVDAFLGSPEFQGLYGAGTGNARLVELLYRNTLERGASGAEIDYYVSRLDAGALDRAQVVLAFSESPEHVGLTAANIMSENPAQFGIAFA